MNKKIQVLTVVFLFALTVSTSCKSNNEGFEDYQIDAFISLFLAMSMFAPDNSYNIGTLTSTSVSAGNPYTFTVTQTTGTKSETLKVYFTTDVHLSNSRLVGEVSIIGGASTTATVIAPTTLGSYYVSLQRSGASYFTAISTNQVNVY